MTEPVPETDLWQTDPETGKLRRRKPAHIQDQAPGEVAGPKGLEPTRYGDWEKKGIVSDF